MAELLPNPSEGPTAHPSPTCTTQRSIALHNGRWEPKFTASEEQTSCPDCSQESNQVWNPNPHWGMYTLHDFTVTQGIPLTRNLFTGFFMSQLFRGSWHSTSIQCPSINILTNVGQPGDKTIIHNLVFPCPLPPLINTNRSISSQLRS